MAKSSPVDDTDARQAIIDAVTSKLKEAEYSARVRAPFATNVLMKDGNYRNKVVSPDLELLFKGMRQSQRSTFIFEFEPVGAAEYTQAEFDEKKIFLAIPEFEAALVNALGFYDEGITWAKAKSKFVVNRRAELEAEKELAVAEEKAQYANDPEWGLF